MFAKDIEMQRALPGDIETIWQTLTQSAHLNSWLGSSLPDFSENALFSLPLTPGKTLLCHGKRSINQAYLDFKTVWGEKALEGALAFRLTQNNGQIILTVQQSGFAGLNGFLTQKHALTFWKEALNRLELLLEQITGKSLY